MIKLPRLSNVDKNALREGIKDGVPIGLGYLAVSFSLGIAARNAGLTPFLAFWVSALCNASAGEYAGITMIAANAVYIEMAIVIFIANARYMLMSCAMSQRMNPDTKLRHRFLMGFYVTDELFAIAINRAGYLNPFYTYGAVLVAAPCWAVGTALGAIAGNVLPWRLVSAFSVALYGMFLAIIIPPGRKNKVVAVLVGICFIASWAFAHLPLISQISSGTRIIILTVVISALAAILFPHKENEEGQK